jgi:hypothetical protein
MIITGLMQIGPVYFTEREGSDLPKQEFIKNKEKIKKKKEEIRCRRSRRIVRGFAASGAPRP